MAITLLRDRTNETCFFRAASAPPVRSRSPRTARATAAADRGCPALTTAGSMARTPLCEKDSILSGNSPLSLANVRRRAVRGRRPATLDRCKRAGCPLFGSPAPRRFTRAQRPAAPASCNCPRRARRAIFATKSEYCFDALFVSASSPTRPIATRACPLAAFAPAVLFNLSAPVALGPGRRRGPPPRRCRRRKGREMLQIARRGGGARCGSTFLRKTHPLLRR